MPWQLDIPLDPGDFSNNVYDQVRIVRQTHDSVSQYIALDLQYGTTVDGSWQSEMQPATKFLSIHVSGAQYVDLLSSSASGDGELTYAAVKRGLYEWLAANDFIASGVVV